jgi:hypothetical protein
LLEAVFFTRRVSVYFNRTNILYEISAAPFAAAARERFKRRGDWRFARSRGDGDKEQIVHAAFKQMG